MSSSVRASLLIVIEVTKVDAMVDEIVLEMVDGEEEEDMLDIVNNKLDSDTMLG